MHVDRDYVWAMETLIASSPGDDVPRDEYRTAKELVDERGPKVRGSGRDRRLDVDAEFAIDVLDLLADDEPEALVAWAERRDDFVLEGL